MDAKLLAVVVMAMCSLVECERGTPPYIRPWRVRNEYIKRGEAETIECLATGNPTPEYRWMYEDRNGRMVDVKNMVDNMVTYDSKTGILTLTKDFNILADGNYSCIAFNEHGKAMTPPISIETADVVNFPGNDQSPSTEVNGFPSKYLKLKCINIKDFKSKPAIDLQWQGGKQEAELKFIKLDLDSRKNLALDKEGSLHFLWLEDRDFDYTYYTCAGYNKIQLVTYTNPFNYNLKQITGNRTPRDPMLVYNKDVTAMAGTTAELQCLFSYYKPTENLEIIWKHRNVEVGRGQIATINTVRVPDDTQDQSGEYQCTPSIGNAVGKVILTIISPPEFIPGQELSAKSVPQGKDAVFRCGTSSYQAHQEAPVWYVNAEKLLDCEDPNHIACKEKQPGGKLKCVARCDGYPHCNDEEDEKGCGVTICGEGDRLCKGTCIDRNAVCDLGAPCTWPRFECKDGSFCINENQICNGVNECTDKSDEQFCPGGEEIQVGRFIVSSDRKELRLPSVTLTDQMCFQCSVKNQHGMVFGDGCLSVIDNIRLNYGPNDTYNVEPGYYINVGVDATTDPLYQEQMNYKWVMYNETVGEDGNVHTEVIPFPFGQYAQYFLRSGSGKNMTIRIPDVNNKEDNNKDDTYKAYLAITRSIKYAINISHPFETLLVNFTIVGSVIEPPPVPVVVVETATFNWWIIALVLAVAVLFIVIALIVCHMYRNRGGTYPLDKKEHQAGHDPAQELKDNAFHDVGRVDDDDFDDKNKADEISLSESVKGYESDEDMTAEYGEDLELSRFNEEGSFIFQYGDKKTKAKEAVV